MRQLLTESVLLAACGAVAGLAVAWMGIRGLSRIVPAGAGDFAGAFTEEVTGLTTIALQRMQLDGSALAFTAAIAMLAAILFGVAPALQSIRTELVGPLRGGRSSDAQSGIRRLTPRNALVMAEVALAVVLLVGAGLVARSLGKLLDVPTGIDAADVLTARISLGGARFQQENAGAMWRDLLDRLRAIPGVDAAGAASCAPLSTDCEGTAIGITADDVVPVELHGATPGYFQALRIPLLAGRDFADTDGSGPTRALIVNQAAVDMYWGGEPPVGRQVEFWGDSAEVIGVVGNVRYDRLEERPRPAVYVPFAQRPFRSAIVFIRSGASTSMLLPAVRSELRGFGTGHALYDVRSMRERTSHAMARTSFIVTALGLFAGVALLLAAIGVYGVIALAVVQRRREIGIRMALGARAGAVVGMLVREGMFLAVLGIASGLLLATVTTRLLEALLYDVTGTDLLTYGAISGILALVTLAATYVPARGVLNVSIVEVIKRE